MNDDKRIYLCLSLTIPLHFPNLWSIIEAMVTIVELCLTLPSIHDYCHLVQSKWLYEQSQAPWLDFLGNGLATWDSCLACAPFVYLWHEEATANICFARVGLVMPANSLWFGLKADKAEGTPFGCAQSRPWAPKSY